MARPKNPENLLREAIAKGDFEAAKKALAQLDATKTKEKKKETKKVQKNEDIIPSFEVEGQKTTNIPLGVKKNNFKPPKDFGLQFIKEDKKIKKGFTERERGGASIKTVKVNCTECNKIFNMEEWEFQAKDKLSDIADDNVNSQQSLICPRCSKNG